MISRITLDHNKLKEEDRRFLLNRNLSEVIANNQGSLSNVSIFLSISAICLAGFSLVYQTQTLWLILGYSVISLAILIYYLWNYKKTQKILESDRQRLKLNYDELFKHHFAYATNRIE